MPLTESAIAIVQGIRVRVGGVDVTNALDGDLWLSLTTPKFSEDGLFPATGDLTLLPTLGYAANFFSPRKNRAQWRRGQPVTVEVRFGGGSLERIFTGFILRRPPTPAKNSAPLVIPIGDELAYRDIDEPADDRAEVKLGSGATRTTIIGRLVADWSGDWLGSIPEYPLDYPVPKYQGSFVQQAGALAASAGYGLYCDRFGDLQAAKFSLTPAHIIDRSYADTALDATDGSDEPAAKVQAVISGRVVEPTERATRDVVIDQGALLTGNGQTGDYIRKRTTIERQWSANYKTLTEEKTVEVPEVNNDTGRIRLIVKTIEETVKKYSGAIDGKLRTRETSIFTGPEFAGLGGRSPVLTSREVETWTYDGEVPLSVELEVYGLAISINGNTGQTTSEETLLRTERTEWAELPGDYWRRTETLYTPFILNDGTVQDVGTSETFYGTQYRPGEPERHVPTDSSTEINYQGEARFGGVADDDGEPAIYEFEYGVSDAQARAIAELHGAVLIGRDAGWTCAMELREPWLGWTPASAARLVLPDGDVGLFLIDGVSRNFSGGAALVTFGCVELGTVGTADITPPRGQIIGGVAPPPVNPPQFFPLQPPYAAVISGEFIATASFESGIIVDDVQPAPAVFEATASFDGGDPLGEAEFFFDAIASFIGP